jgi:hypothetical protein
MSAAALTPRVRSMVLCDDVTAHETEDGVFNLQGVRAHLIAESFPYRAELHLFLLLSSPQQGIFGGKVLAVDDSNDKSVRYVKFPAVFERVSELLPLDVEIGPCVFPQAGQYTFQVFFQSKTKDEALKGEMPFHVLQYEE